MQHLLDRAADCVSHFAAGRVVGLRQPRVETGQLGVDDLVRTGPQRGHGRRDGQLLLLGQVPAELLGTIIAEAACTRLVADHRAAGTQRVEIDVGDAGQRAHGGIDVARQGQVEHDQRALRAVAEHRCLDDEPGRAGGGDEQVGLGDDGGELAQSGSAGAKDAASRSARSALRLATTMSTSLAAPAQRGSGKRAHRPGADDDRPHPVE